MSPSRAYICAVLFLLCSGHAFLCVTNRNGIYEFPMGMIGVALAGPALFEPSTSTGTVGSFTPGDLINTATYLVAILTAVLALLLIARPRPVRYLLAIVGGTVTLYYAYAIFNLLLRGFERYMTLVYLGVLLWFSATLLALLPVTRRAMGGA
jgi:hypothetical protein